MTKRNTIETAFEIARIFIFGKHWRDSAAWCSECESYVLMISLSAADLDKTTTIEIFRRVETGELHHEVSGKGALSVCLSSLIDTKRTPINSNENSWNQPILN